MTDEEALIADCVEAPDDDMPRLVYADYLMQQGDRAPRGEYIALQCALASAARSNTVLANEVDAVARERSLREAYFAEWLAPLQALAHAGFAMRRGFVEHVVALEPNAWIDPTALLAALPMLRSLAISASVIAREVLATMPPRITELHLLELEDLLPHATFTNLFAMPAMQRVVQLHLIHARIDPDTVDVVLAPFTTRPITALTLDLNRFYSERPVDGPRIHARLEQMTGLRSLALGKVPLDVRLAKHDLESLVVYDAEIDVVSLKQLIEKWPHLHTLVLDNCTLTSSYERLASVIPKTLRRLAIRRANLRDAAIVRIVEAATKLGVRRIDLRGNDIANFVAHQVTKVPGAIEILIDDTSRSVVRPYRDPPPRYPASIEAFLGRREKINAIKEYRALTGIGLAGAKLAVERIMDELEPIYVP